MVLHLGQVIGNLISSFILTAATGHHQLEDQVQKWYRDILISAFQSFFFFVFMQKVASVSFRSTLCLIWQSLICTFEFFWIKISNFCFI